MYTKKQHIVRKTIIVSVLFLLGFASAIFAAATYDANVQTRATRMFGAIKSNASTLATVDQQAYYNLVHLNIQSLMQVLTSVDTSLMVEMGTTQDLDDGSITDEITNPTSVSATITSSATSCTIKIGESTCSPGPKIDGVVSNLPSGSSVFIAEFVNGQTANDFRSSTQITTNGAITSWYSHPKYGTNYIKFIDTIAIASAKNISPVITITATCEQGSTWNTTQSKCLASSSTTTTITFDMAGATSATISPITQSAGTPVTAPANPTRSGYIFNGWSPIVPTTMLANNVTLVAQWTSTATATTPSCAIQYTGVQSQRLTQGHCREGSTPFGFAETTISGGYGYSWGCSIGNSDVGCQATYTPATTTTTITFDANGGSGHTPTTKTITQGAAIGALPSNPTKTNFTFSGWFTLATGGTQVTASTIPTQNTTYFAHWTSNDGSTFTCLTKPSYLTTTNATFVNGTPTSAAQQTWQNTTSSSACYYSCKTGYSGTQCAADSTGGGGTGGGGSNLGCTRGGVSYIDGDVRCDGNKQVRCDNGSFKQIYTCSSGDICTENPDRTTNGNFYTSCKREYQILYTYGGNGSIYGLVDQAETSTLKELAQYSCKYNIVTRKYGNCEFQSCITGQSHDEGGNCISNVRDCEITNTTNGGRQTWSNGAWGTCQATSSTACATGYRMMDGICKTGGETCNSFVSATSSKNLLREVGVDYSTKTYNGYAGGGVWTYDTNLAEACTWKCEDGYKRTSEISGWRGQELCVKKNICDDDEYFNTAWTSADHANQACHSCKLTAPYGGSSPGRVYTSSTKRGDYNNMIERLSGENQSWKYISNRTVDTLAESCTWACADGLIPGYVKSPMSASGPLTCCSASDPTCKAAICEPGKECRLGIVYVRFGNLPISEIEVREGETLGSRLTTPTKTGSLFAGWYTNSFLTGTPVTSTTPITREITTSQTSQSVFLYAKWTTQ